MSETQTYRFQTDGKSAAGHEVEIAILWDNFWENYLINKDRGYLKDTINAKTCKGCEKGKTGIVIGSGPSLLKNIKDLKKLLKRDDVFSICADRTFQTLLDNGIMPDYCMTMDQSPLCATYLEKASKSHKTKFLVSVVSNPVTYMMFRLKKIPIYTYAQLSENSLFWACFEAEEGTKWSFLRSGSIVGFTATDFAVKAGAKRVYLIGQDLCVYQGEFDRTSNECLYANYNFKIPDTNKLTNLAFVQASVAFMNLPVSYPKVEFIDLSGGLDKGMKIKNIKEAI